MTISPQTVRAQMFRLKPLLSSRSLETIRKGQNMIGELMGLKYSKEVFTKEHKFENFTGEWVVPLEERRRGVILYLHGGGYVCGDIRYVKGFSSMLAVQCGAKIFSPAYRLAPENPFPAAVEDAFEAYKYLLSKGYLPKQITLCGESAGGGLCYSLCLKLREESVPMPAGIIAISPWVDLTISGESYKENTENDPSMTSEILRFYSDCYTKNPTDPLASPVFADVKGLPPSLIFAAKEELMRSDSEQMHELLRKSGCESSLYLKSERWHAYILYGLADDSDDFTIINQYLNKVMSPERMLRWLRLDNAAKIYPAARSNTWSNVFRVSVSLKEDIDKETLRSALNVTARRFPSICARLRRGIFWYYLEQLSEPPKISEDSSYPLTRMSHKEISKCALRVLVYKNRLAVEFFHSLTDGTGAMIFLKSLTAEYLQQKYGVSISNKNGILGRLDEPSEAELEDSFQKYAGPIQASRKENDAFHISGTLEAEGFLNLTCFKIPVKEILDAAHKYNVSITVFLTAAFMHALQKIQAEQCPNVNKRKRIKILIPVNLRNVFESRSLRNFALYTTPEIDPRQGEYDFSEICKIVSTWMSFDITKKTMSAKIATNISAERLLIVRLMPLFLKNIVMKAVYNAVGEKKSCFSLSNLGNQKVSEEMTPYVERFDFILGAQAKAPYNCGVISYGDTLNINVIRKIRESEMELEFFKVLQEHGITVSVESNHL
mgnify:CR=1 FL=1